ncbi:response regulator [Viridibacillus sp. YIM B01967]|uniref:histidine kinase n=1 Tax=Viridibacillus soli TaxID=2798301 RepID=A0ABS1HC62_9BACL|nr:ATP-binding protein [Viridibacillus soli]MBK3497034.1 response regulator [Viridibacillus soli]
MKRKLFIAGCIGIFLFTVISSFSYFNIFEPNGPDAKNGVLDLSNWNFERDGNVNLNGEWQFYAGDLITPDKKPYTFDEYNQKLTTIHVPGNWNKQNIEQYATYRLLIKLPNEGTYGFKTDIIRSSSRLFINGVEAGAKGNPSKNMRINQYSDEKYVAYGAGEDKEIEVVIQVANLDYHVAGIISPLKFGTAKDIEVSKTMDVILDTALFAGYFLLFIMYLVTYLQRKKNFYELYFSLFCFFQGFYITTLNEQLFFIQMPDLSWLNRAYFQFTFIHLAILFFLLFIYDFFKQYTNKKIVIFICSLLIVQELIEGMPNPIIGLLAPPIIVEKMVIISILGLSYGYIVYILLKALLKKAEDSEYILMIVTSFGCYVLLIGLHFLFEVKVKYGPVFLFLTMVIGLSSLIGFRHQRAFTEVDRLSKELLRFDEAKDDFLIKSSHELRTPLHGIINLSKSLMEGNEGALKKEQQEVAFLIHTVGKRLANLVEDLIYAGKIKRGEVNISPTPVNVYIVEEIISEVFYLIPTSNNLELVNKFPSNLPLIYVDEYKLKQIFFNLIYNAIKYTKQGEITLSAKVQNGEMVISITDTGIGIEKDHINQIFTSFYQVKGIESEGIGLGLSITKQLVEASGGRIWVTSKIGKGSCFTFTIPLANESQLKEMDNSEYLRTEKRSMSLTTKEQAVSKVFLDVPVKIEGKKGYTILVVDDDHSNLRILVNFIRSLDYTVIAVESGVDALKIIENESVDLMLLDLMMPNMSGFEVCKIVREEHCLLELPIVILTAAGQLTDLIISLQGGANDFLQKPINLEELQVRIESLLSMKESSREAVKNELNFLSAQITPHFLYNTFNTIIGLSYKDEEKTREALQYLSTYFRAKLDFNAQNSLIPLENEIELVKAYLSIEKMRFGNRLTIEYDIDETIEALIPSMTIQPLVENAVQHGIAKKPNGGTVKVTIVETTAGVKIMIEDDGVGIPIQKQDELMNERSTRIGFSNPFRKLKLIKKASFLLESNEGEGTKITIIVPLGQIDESSINR